jgi:hypothetical protein
MGLSKLVHLATPDIYNRNPKKQDFPNVLHLAFGVWETDPEVAPYFTFSSKLQVLYNLTRSKV